MPSIDTVNDLTPRVQYVALAAQTEFDYPFPIFADADLVVLVDGEEQALNTDYTVAGEGDDAGGTITWVGTAFEGGEIVTIYRDIPIERDTDIAQNGPWSSTTYNDEQDKIFLIMQQLKSSVNRCLRLPIASEIIDADLELDPASFANMYLTFDADGVPTPAALSSTTMTQAVIGQLLYPRTAAEIAAGVTPTDYSYPPGYEGRFGMVSDSSTNNVTALQNLIDGSAGDVPVRIRRRTSGYYRFTGRVTAPANTHIILESGPELRWTATTATGTALLGVATRPGIEVQGNNFRIEGRGVLKGPSVGVYVSNEAGIFGKGASSASRNEGFYIGPGVELTQWGSYGVVLQYWNWINISGLKSYGNGGYGACFFSCNHGRALGILVGDITPGPGSEPIGFCLTHNSAGYNADTEVLAGRQRTAAEPFCQDWEVSGTAYDIPLWHGFNTHGCFDCNFHDINTYNCKYGVQVAGSSNDAGAYAGENTRLSNIFCTTKRRDGSATTIAVLDGTGILMNGGATVRHRNVHLSNFVVEGYGESATAGGAAVRAIQVTGTITNGHVRNWQRHGIYSYYADLQIGNVTFGPVAVAANSVCIYNDQAVAASNIDVLNCRVLLEGGTAPAEGLRITTGNNRAVLAGNDFSPCTAPYAGVDGTKTKGLSDFVPQITVTGTPTSVDLSAAAGAPRVRVYFNCSGNSTVSNFTGFTVGQVVECYFPIAAATAVTTIDRSNGFLAGAANFVSTQYDTLVLEFVNTSGVKFVERSRSANS